MKILIISPTSSGIGGIAGVVQNQIKFLKKQGHQVDVISSENTFIIPVKGLKNPSFMISSFLKTKYKKNYDVVHAHNPASGLAMNNISGKKIISLWGVFENQVQLLHGSILSKLSGKFERKILEHADAIIVASKEIQKYYYQLGYESHYIPNAIDLESLSKKEERLFKNQIIFVGRLSKEKGILDLLAICEKIPKETHLIIIGSGPEANKVKNTSEKYTNIHYLGYQPNTRTIELIRGSDMLIQPSLMEGGMNSTLLESMACKTSVITTSLKVYENDVRHLDTAYCIKPNSPNELLQAIIILISDKQLRLDLSENAYQIALNYSWDKIGEKFIEIYKKLLNF
ncbi:MAG: glycosyltransferase family 4 protein [Candidatus Nitrosopumilus sp. bin_32a]